MAQNPKALSSKYHIVPLTLYQKTPRTNCGDCGFASCLAYATQVVKGEAAIEACPHLNPSVKESIGSKIQSQLKEGYGLKKENFQIALEYLMEKLRKEDLKNIAERHKLLRQDDKKGFLIPYLNMYILLTEEGLIPQGKEIDPWEKIFILNYLLRDGGTVSGEWVGMEVLPGSISKMKNLEKYCEHPLRKAANHNLSQILKAATTMGGRADDSKEADLSIRFDVLPGLPIRILFWDAEEDEGFEARVKFLFDRNVLSAIDLESLWFACEKITDRLLNSIKNDAPSSI